MKGQLAEEYFKQGYNCSQSVFLAFAEDLGLEKGFALRLASGFGGGMGRMREVCGAVSGMIMAVSAKHGYDDPKAREQKKEVYALMRRMADEFKEETGSIICRELLGLPEQEAGGTPEERTADYYKKRPCAELCRIAADIAENYF